MIPSTNNWWQALLADIIFMSVYSEWHICFTVWLTPTLFNFLRNGDEQINRLFFFSSKHILADGVLQESLRQKFVNSEMDFETYTSIKEIPFRTEIILGSDTNG